MGEELRLITEVRRRTDYNVRPYSASTACGLIQRSITDANQRQDHRDFDTYGQHA